MAVGSIPTYAPRRSARDTLRGLSGVPAAVTADSIEKSGIVGAMVEVEVDIGLGAGGMGVRTVGVGAVRTVRGVLGVLDVTSFRPTSVPAPAPAPASKKRAAEGGTGGKRKKL
eukprot:CAMPEP_0173230730 /NCGR_PEP_ID=MMETSP1142-20121109/7938_1 /TAXON_ID=483371 /ORGANISM="non described non described, Strain CCMP2298" /LENGTH=112 /DNA_ID=CAMNT_0014159903 /DNA_START=292 /DNA_END=630 /DNA_ORIENTATION=-